MRFSVSLILLFCMFFFVACQPSGMQQMPEEATMERILQENPDSLANLLEEIINPFMLPEMQKADYARWLTKTHLRQGRSLMNDTLIHYSVEYYKKADYEHLLEAYLLAAEQADWKKVDAPQREQILYEALQCAQALNDTTVIHKIVSTLSGIHKMPEDDDKINELIHVTKRYAGDQNYINVCLNQRKLFALLGQKDSVLLYTRKGIELLHEQNDSREYNLTRDYARMLSLSGQGENALKVLKDIEDRIPVGNEIKLDYIIILINMGKLDSAQVYIDSFYSLIQESITNSQRYSDNDDFEYMILELFLGEYQSIIDTKKGKLYSIEFTNSLIEKIFNNSRNRMKIEREQQFVQNKLIQDNINLDIDSSRLKQHFLWAGIGMLFVIVLIVFFYQRKLLRKERSIQQIKEQLHLHSLQLSENELLINKNDELIRDLSSQIDESGELKQEISMLVGENENLKQKNISLQKDIELYSKLTGKNNLEMATYEKLVLQNAKYQERERFLTTQLVTSTPLLNNLSKKPHYIDATEWIGIIHAVNQLFDGFSYRLSLDFPCLTEEDIQYCCLIKIRLSSSVIATLTGISPSSVTKRKLRIKEKMNQQNPSEVQKEKPIEIYLWKYS